MGTQNRGVAVREHCEVVALDIEEGEDDVLPAISEDNAAPFGESVSVDGVGSVDEVEEDVVEESLEGGDGSAFGHQQRGKRIGAGDTEGEDLAESEDKPEIFGSEVGEFGLPGFRAWCSGSVLDSFWECIIMDFWERLVTDGFWQVRVLYNLWQDSITDDFWRAMAGRRPIARTARCRAKVDACGTYGRGISVFENAHGGEIVCR